MKLSTYAIAMALSTTLALAQDGLSVTFGPLR